jgi:hypothetical protein
MSLHALKVRQKGASPSLLTFLPFLRCDFFKRKTIEGDEEG